jgi:hypothetical protein
LFKGLAINTVKPEWTQYPVLHFNFGRIRCEDSIGRERGLSLQLSEYEEFYGRDR